MSKPLKFDEPVKTKSGEQVIVLWKELQECWSNYKKARSSDELIQMQVNAKRIQEIQDDLGLTVAKFPELDNKMKCQVCDQIVKLNQSFRESYNGFSVGISHLKCARSMNR